MSHSYWQRGCRVVQDARECGGRGEPVARILGEHARNRANDIVGERAACTRQRRGLLCDMLGHGCHRVRTRERRDAAEQLEGNASKRIQIAASIDVAFTAGLLGTHVGRRPERHSDGRQRVQFFLDERARNAEIRQ